MKDKKDLFDLNPSLDHVERIEQSVESLLAQKRTEEKRKRLVWILVPTFASFFGLYIWKSKTGLTDHLMAELDLLTEVENEADLELFTDLELIEELENMEDWDGTEEA